MKTASTVGMIQLGCDKNTVDGERILGELHEAGYDVRHPDERRLGLLIVNACSFIASAREESMKAIEHAAEMKRKGRARRIAVAGCFSPLEKKITGKLREEIDFFIPPGDIPKTREIVAGEEEAHFRPPARSMDPGPRLLASSGTTAFVRVAEGCNKRCAFCTIPSIRGKFVSRPLAEILDEIEGLVTAGVREIVLVSQDTVVYGRDIGESLAGLIKSIGELDLPDFRLRVHYLYPSQVGDDFIEAIAQNRFAVPYFDLPIQHASPVVLKAMRRPSDVGAMRDLFGKIRSAFPESAIRTTVITGHPGETKDEFLRMIDFIEEIEFDRLGVFAFSPEPETPAYSMKRPRGANERAGRVMKVQAAISRRRLAARVGRTYTVLMDSDGEGRSAFEAPDVDGVIHVEGATGELVTARVTSSDTHDLFAQRA